MMTTKRTTKRLESGKKLEKTISLAVTAKRAQAH